MDYSQFAEGVRQDRERGFAALKEVVAAWATEKPKFRELLRREMNFGAHRRSALAHVVERVARATAEGDGMGLMNAALEPVWREFQMLKKFLRQDGSEQDAIVRVGKFWDWPNLRQMPYNRISAYLFAAFGRRVAMGQRKFTPGLMNDFQSIAAYAPYVDAMFLDRECASLLNEGDLIRELQYRSQIFSYENANSFLDYLRELEARATPEVRAYANRIYGM